MTPAVEDGKDGEEKEDVAPLQEEVVRVESLQGARGDDTQHHQVERQPGDQERSLPAPKTMTSEAVTHCWNRGEYAESSSTENHALFVRSLVS